jgi:hypothetical protein
MEMVQQMAAESLTSVTMSGEEKTRKERNFILIYSLIIFLSRDRYKISKLRISEY